MNESDNAQLPSQVITIVGAGSIIQAAKAVGRQVDILQYTTQNEKHGILATESLGRKSGNDFLLQYYAIGGFGSQYVGVNVNGSPKLRVNEHEPIDHNLFGQLPFACRPLTADFTTAEREKYRMRQVVTVNGIRYAVYWLKVVGFLEFDPKMKLVTVDRDTMTEEVENYIPESDTLNPVPRKLTSSGTVPVSNQYQDATGKIDLSLTKAELDEIKNACRILYNDSSLAAINEYAVLWGTETSVNGDIGTNGSTPMKEVQTATIQYHITETHARDANANGGIDLLFDLCTSTPMMLATERTTTP